MKSKMHFNAKHSYFQEAGHAHVKGATSYRELEQLLPDFIPDVTNDLSRS